MTNEVPAGGIPKEAPLRIGLLGCGALGAAIGQRMLDLDWKVTVYNRTPRRTRALVDAGACFAATPNEAVRDADWVVSAVTDSTALNAVLLGKDGAVMSAPRPSIVIDLGTHRPGELKDMAARLEQMGVRFIESPVTGSVADASRGTLGFLMGGSEGDVALATPFLERLGQRVYHIGPVGAGNTAKLALNLLVGVMAHGLGESIAMIEAAGLNSAQFLQALGHSGLASPLYQRIGQRYLERDFAARFSLANLGKDMAWARDHSRELGCTSSLSELISAFIERVDAPTKEHDYSILIKQLSSANA